MRRITLLLMVMASALLAASGVAWAVTKTCPPTPQVCYGTSGADVLKSTSQDNDMYGQDKNATNNLVLYQGGNDTYTNFVKGNSGIDVIGDYGGRDTLQLTNYLKSEVGTAPADIATVSASGLQFKKNGKADTLAVALGPTGKHGIFIIGYYDDSRSKPPYRFGPGRIEEIVYK
jgi:hypothetical protein